MRPAKKNLNEFVQSGENKGKAHLTATNPIPQIMVAIVNKIISFLVFLRP